MASEAVAIEGCIFFARFTPHFTVHFAISYGCIATFLAAIIGALYASTTAGNIPPHIGLSSHLYADFIFHIYSGSVALLHFTHNRFITVCALAHTVHFSIPVISDTHCTQ